MTANGLISQALGLQASYFVLKGKSQEVLSTDINRKVLVFTGLSQSSSIILSFALEIALKGLLKFRLNSFPRIHDLKKLYENLDANDRLKISEIYRQKTNSDISECLDRHKDMFMEFRYLDIEIEELNDNEKVNEALNSVINFYNILKSNI